MKFRSGTVWQTGKAAVLSLLIGVAACFLFAALYYFFPMPSAVVRVIAQVLKAGCLLLGCFLCLSGEGGWWKGLLSGGIFGVLSLLFFGWFGGGGLSAGALIDLAFCLIVGALGGIAAVNLKRG